MTTSTAPKPINQELSQAKARLGVSLFALAYVAAWSLFSSPVAAFVVWVLVAYAVFSTGWLLLIRAWPEEVPWRRVVVIVSDLGINTFFMHVLQAKGAFFYPMYLWITVGNGMRFGPRYLVLAMVVNVAYFAPMLFLSAYWRENAVAGSGLLAGLIVLPLFYLSLIKNLLAVNQRLNEEVERSQAAVRTKSEFLANISHELRTPMSGVIGIAELLRETPLTAAQQAHIDLIHRSAHSLLRIIDDVLEISRIEARKVELKAFSLDLHSIVEDVYHLLRPGADEKGLDLRLHLPDHAPRIFYGDSTRIRQILINVVGNAVKFTEHGHVALDYEWEQRPDNRMEVRFRISDTGIGIAHDKLEHVFDQFEQAETRLSRRFGGSGLGLAISRHLARLMEGDVTVTSQLHSGTTFTVSLVLEASDEPVTKELIGDEVPGSWRRLQVLVVEDNPVNWLVVEGYLKKLGMSAVLAEDGMAALDVVREGNFDLVLMDVQLPVLDGLEATRRIRAREGEGCHLPIVALTANAFDEDCEACLDAGMDFHLRKPMRLIDLTRAILTLERRGLLPD